MSRVRAVHGKLAITRWPAVPKVLPSTNAPSSTAASPATSAPAACQQLQRLDAAWTVSRGPTPIPPPAEARIPVTWLYSRSYGGALRLAMDFAPGCRLLSICVCQFLLGIRPRPMPWSTYGRRGLHQCGFECTLASTDLACSCTSPPSLENLEWSMGSYVVLFYRVPMMKAMVEIQWYLPGAQGRYKMTQVC